MRTRGLIALATLGLFATACISSSTPAVDYGSGQRFVPVVVDSTDDMGRGDAVAVNADGLPYVSYFGFAAELKEGEIAVPRPFGAPTVPGVMLATSSSDGLWQRGAVNTAEPDIEPTGVSIPFGPVETPDLELTPENTNGSAMAVGDDGTVHVAWTAGNGVTYASTKLGGTSTVQGIFGLKQRIKQAGPIGRPGIALDAAGAPWVAVSVQTSKGIEIHALHPEGADWTDEVVATTASCNGCTPQPTGVGVVGGDAVVVYADAAASKLMAATRTQAGWSSTTAASGVAAAGLSFTVSDDTAHAAYYSGDGSVDLATWSKGAWQTQPVADAADPDPGATGNDAPTTAVAVGGDGAVYVAWEDAGIQMASAGDQGFAPVDIGHTVASGADPSLAGTDTGVALAWYDTAGENQMIGYWGDATDVLIAQPSPSLIVSQGGGGGGECGTDRKTALDLVAQNIAFDPTCLVAPAGEPFTISFDNEDAGIPHNVNVMTESGGDEIAKTEPKPGVYTEPLDVDALDPGVYFFQCDVHPTMTGQLAVVKGAK